jgi:hypothetical protein
VTVPFRSFVSAAATATLVLTLPLTALAQPPAGTDASDYTIHQAEPDFALAALPTTLRIPSGKFAFRMTHRFSRPIAGTCPDEGPKPDGCGGLGAFVENFFGFDSSSKVGLELRFGVRPGTQAAVLRTNDRAIQFAAHHQLLRQTDETRITLDLVAAIEGQDNFREDHTLTVGTVLSHQIADRGAVYVHPVLLFNSNPLPDADTDDNHTMMLGVGGRLRLGASRVYLVAEAAPRLAGFKPGVDHVSFAIERRSGGHMFQLNVSNSFAASLRQVAHGGPGNGDWFIGFNLSRRFY